MPRPPRLGPKHDFDRNTEDRWYIEHPSVSSRTNSEVESWRETHGVFILDRNGQEPPKPLLSFEETPFPDWATRQMRFAGHTAPTAVQAQLWPAIAVGRDIVAIASTGSGKTLAYALPTICRAVTRQGVGKGPFAMIAFPTVELARQTKDVIAPFLAHGGVIVRFATHCAETMKRWTDYYDFEGTILLGTPQQLAKLSSSALLRRLSLLVLDEADALCDEPHLSSVKDLLEMAPLSRQLVCVSATFPDTALRFCRSNCKKNAFYFQAGTSGAAVSKAVKQHFKIVTAETKMRIFCEEVLKASAMFGPSKAIVFCSACRTVHDVVNKLADIGIEALAVHESVPEAERFEAIQKFEVPDTAKVMVATSLVGRGHNFPNVRFVMNFDMPPRIVEYIHRVGRCGRDGQMGFAMTMLVQEDFWLASALKKLMEEAGNPVPAALDEAEAVRERTRAEESRRKWMAVFRQRNQGTWSRRSTGWGNPSHGNGSMFLGDYISALSGRAA